MPAPAAILATFHTLRHVPSRKVSRVLEPVERFFMQHIPEPNSGCWLWIGAVTQRDYGTIRVGGEAIRAHRWAYENLKGEIPTGMHVLHKCDTPACVNPDHLYVGTPKDNSADRIARGRERHPSGADHPRRRNPHLWPTGAACHLSLTGHLRRGEKNGRAKLTAEEVTQIRASPLGCVRLARSYGVSSQTIKRIRNGKLWRHE